MTKGPIDLSMSTKPQDVHSEASQILDWSAEHRHQSLRAVYQRAEDHALKAINWYLISKKEKNLMRSGSGWVQSF